MYILITYRAIFVLYSIRISHHVYHGTFMYLSVKKCQIILENDVLARGETKFPRYKHFFPFSVWLSTTCYSMSILFAIPVHSHCFSPLLAFRIHFVSHTTLIIQYVPFYQCMESDYRCHQQSFKSCFHFPVVL